MAGSGSVTRIIRVAGSKLNREGLDLGFWVRNRVGRFCVARRSGPEPAQAGTPHDIEPPQGQFNSAHIVVGSEERHCR
jgi:hypothetical protein